MRDGYGRARRVVLACATLIAVVATSPPAFGAAPFLPPVKGRVVKSFEAPLGPYSRGHRGVDIAAPPGSKVVAAAEGRVKFAGPVGGDGLFVTIAHSGDLETTYSYLSRIEVAAGTAVARGQTIGASGEGHPGSGTPALHFGVKKSGKYIDPEILLRDLDDISNMIALAPLEEDGGSSRGRAGSGGDDPRFGWFGSDVSGKSG
ncbi:MAG: M23 family metallopeptidase, partial [Actinomycetota bacterium]|nr:M23 family metallopeptidase [Actinomycetota bacterium]